MIIYISVIVDERGGGGGRGEAMIHSSINSIHPASRPALSIEPSRIRQKMSLHLNRGLASESTQNSTIFSRFPPIFNKQGRVLGCGGVPGGRGRRAGGEGEIGPANFFF